MPDLIMHQLIRHGGQLTRTELWRAISSWRNAEVADALAQLKREGAVVEMRRLGRTKRIRSVIAIALDDAGEGTSEGGAERA